MMPFSKQLEDSHLVDRASGLDHMGDQNSPSMFWDHVRA
jgi:hypothetical protein